MARDPMRLMNCRKCVAAGEAEPFRGTFAELGRHHQTAHPRGAASAAGGPSTPPAADVSRETSELGDEGGETAGGDYTHPRESVPGGATIVDGEVIPRKKSWRERLWGAGADESEMRSPVDAPTSSKERAPVRGRRSSTDKLFEMGWRFIGSRLERSETDVIVGRCMVYQSPVAGDVLERLTKGTIIDRILQPLAAKSAELETASALFMLPVLLGMLERNPAAEAVLVPMIQDVLRVHLVAMVPIVKRQRKEQEELADAVRDLYPDAPPGTDPTELILREMIAGTALDPDAMRAPAPGATESAA